MFVLGNSTTKINLGNRCKPNSLSRGKKKEKKRYYKKKGGDAHVCREWDSDESSTDSSSDEVAANIAVNKGLLFPQCQPQVPHGKGRQEEGKI
jgi:hypothetical protein